MVMLDLNPLTIIILQAIIILERNLIRTRHKPRRNKLQRTWHLRGHSLEKTKLCLGTSISRTMKQTQGWRQATKMTSSSIMGKTWLRHKNLDNSPTWWCTITTTGWWIWMEVVTQMTRWQCSVNKPGIIWEASKITKDSLAG